ncbi:MAG: phage minor head protein [Sphingomonadaceae bacterium]
MTDPHASAISGAFHRPFTEQIAFFRQKLGNRVPTQAWDDLTREGHDSAFMVAGAVKADLLSDLAAAVDKAIAEGRGMEEFHTDFRDIVRRNGWAGWTGEGSVKGEAWRVATILRTNAMTSYAAGRYAQLKASNFKYWVYRHGGSKEPRPEHLDWDGLILSPDHVFWRTHYPPSDWGCSCYVLGAHTLAAAKRMGGHAGKSLPDNWQVIDPKTGAPPGIGRHWNYAPGASVLDKVQALAGKVRHWQYALTKGFMDSLPYNVADALAESYRSLPSTAADLRRYAAQIYVPQQGLPDPAPIQSMGRVTSKQADVMSAAAGSNAKGFDYSLTPSEIRHIIRRHGDDAAEKASGQRAVRPEDFGRLPELLRAANPVYDGLSDTGRPIFVFTTVIDGERHQAAFEMRGKRRTLTLISYRIGRKK